MRQIQWSRHFFLDNNYYCFYEGELVWKLPLATFSFVLYISFSNSLKQCPVYFKGLGWCLVGLLIKCWEREEMRAKLTVSCVYPYPTGGKCLGLCNQCRSRLSCTSVQSEHGLHCLLYSHSVFGQLPFRLSWVLLKLDDRQGHLSYFSSVKVKRSCLLVSFIELQLFYYRRI